MMSARSGQIEVRYVGALAGRYNLTLPAHADDSTAPDKPATYACRTLSLSPTSLVVAAPVSGDVGTPVAFLFDHIGFVRATISRHVANGFEARIASGDAEREALAGRITWLKNHRLRKTSDKRQAPRRYPRQPGAWLYLDGGTEETCFVIDVSATGASVSSRVKPPLGTALALGQLDAIVVRHLDHGFAIRFASPVALEALEPSITARRAN